MHTEELIYQREVFEVNFGIKIDKYIAVNFVSFIRKDEIEKEYIAELGKQRLNGY